VAVRKALATLMLVGLVAACAPARAASPPVPELVGAQPATTHVAVELVADHTDLDQDRDPDRQFVGVHVVGPAVSGESNLDDLAGDDLAGDDLAGDDLAGDDLAGDDLAGVAPTGVEVDAVTGWEAFDRSLERSIISNGSPGLSVAVMSHGQLVRSSALGRHGVGSGRPVDEYSRFRVASISKIITAVVVLQLVDEGLMELDRPIGARLAAGLGLGPVSPGVAALTAEHLLSHTSGFGSYQNSFFSERQLTCADVGAQALASGSATPGSGMRYSNMNYCLAHLLIEEVTGQSYTDAVYERLLTPLGITGMRLAGTYDTGPDEVVHFSRPGRNYMEALGGAGAWIATATDIARIVDSLDPATPGWRPLGPDLLARMRQPPLGRADGGYGLGLILYPDGSVGHTGTLESTHAMVVSRPDGVTWALLVNGEHPRQSASLRSMVDRAFVAGFPDG
jgi:D-alanyl-D-alanine carboxypeptidase